MCNSARKIAYLHRWVLACDQDLGKMHSGGDKSNRLGYTSTIVKQGSVTRLDGGIYIWLEF